MRSTRNQFSHINKGLRIARQQNNFVFRTIFICFTTRIDPSHNLRTFDESSAIDVLRGRFSHSFADRPVGFVTRVFIYLISVPLNLRELL